ncbi:MAG: FAD-dependent oxidoreductase [Flavobacteriaceae bacterium]
MKNNDIFTNKWTVCIECKGLGKKRQKVKKKHRREYQLALDAYMQSDKNGQMPIKPKGHLAICKYCKGTGLTSSNEYPKPDDMYPHVAIIGAGIGGVALAVACLHRGIPFTLFERDESFDARSQGYGLTLQQASKAMAGFGIPSLEKGVVSTRHIVHTTDGEIIGEWGMRKWLTSEPEKKVRKTNIHIARQSLRMTLLEQLGGDTMVQWNHKLQSYKEDDNDAVDLNFDVNGVVKHFKADLVVGADGIRSSVRNQLIGEHITPLRYLGCIVILGICPLTNLSNNDHPLLDSATVFQTANGNERIYMMPYDSDSIMWQLSFPISEDDAKELSQKGPSALKKEACRRLQWHDPIPQILSATEDNLISGYPVYDRELLSPEMLKKSDKVTLIGDAAHPMSPFKGQGANQALLDALALARGIYKGCRPLSNWRGIGLRDSVLNEFETEMLARSASKVKGSAEAAEFLHSDIVLHKANQPRGRCVKAKE